MDEAYVDPDPGAYQSTPKPLTGERPEADMEIEGTLEPSTLSPLSSVSSLNQENEADFGIPSSPLERRRGSNAKGKILFHI
jgi:hypothetical protein